MDRRSWSTCTYSYAMLEYLESRGERRDRKLRLFACACCRSVWELLADERSRAAVEVAERFADGLASFDDLSAAAPAAMAVGQRGTRRSPWNKIRLSPTAQALRGVASVTREVAWEAAWEAARESVTLLQDRQGDLLRDIFGDPFSAPRLDRAWLSWDDGLVGRMARSVYDDRDPDLMPVLGDALEDAGCDDPEILAHCRSGEEHVRGCWVVDLLLGKS